jgi:hypothetical protein
VRLLNDIKTEEHLRMQQDFLHDLTMTLANGHLCEGIYSIGDANVADFIHRGRVRFSQVCKRVPARSFDEYRPDKSGRFTQIF